MLDFMKMRKFPRDKRLKTILLAGPGMLVLFLGWFVSTIIFMLVMIKIKTYNIGVITLFGVIFLMLVIGDILMAFPLVNLLHWAITGFPIKTWEDLKYWH